DRRLPADRQRVREDDEDRERLADEPAQPDDARRHHDAHRDDGDVLAGHCEQVLEAARLEGVPQLPVDARVLAEDDAREQTASLPRGSTGERRLHVRAQPVADATDPAPPADDAPAVVAAQYTVRAATRDPTA